MDAAFLVAASLSQIGSGMAIVGLVLGVGFHLQTRLGRRPCSAYEQGQNDIWSPTAKPLIVIGFVGAVLWIVSALRWRDRSASR